MMLIPGAHNAETIKIAIQEMMNRYDKYDKGKIQGVVSDEGSSLVSLFSQLITDQPEMSETEAASK